MKPKPEPVDPDKLYELAHAVIKDAKFPMLATVDETSQPRVRPVSPVRVDPDFTVYVANLASYQKTGEIAANPKVELAYLSPNHDQIRITGAAEVVSDESDRTARPDRLAQGGPGNSTRIVGTGVECRTSVASRHCDDCTAAYAGRRA